MDDILKDFENDLRTQKSPESIDLLECGRGVWQHLDSAACAVLCSQPLDSKDYQDMVITLSTLHTLANEQINALPYKLVAKCWLRLYTDVALLWSLLDLFRRPAPENDAPAEAEEAFWRGVVRRLDMAIIVAGAIGDKRMEWIQHTIKAAQTRCHSRMASSSEAAPSITPPIQSVNGRRSTKRRKIETQTLEIAPKEIPRLSTPPSMGQYLQKYRHVPFILPGFLNSPESDSQCPPWPAVRKWGNPAYLEELVGPGRVVPVEVGKAYTDVGWGQQIISFTEFLDCIYRSDSNLPPLYLAQHPLLTQFPELEQDIVLPDYVYSCPERTEDGQEHIPPQNADGLVVNAWVGAGRGTVTSPAHTDPYYNCYAQVVGIKRVWLAPPSCTPHMHPANSEPKTTTTSYTDNTSSFPILRKHPSEWLDDIDAGKFKDQVIPQSLEAILEPGDLLIFPPGWWHAMRGEGDQPGWSVSMWY